MHSCRLPTNLVHRNSLVAGACRGACCCLFRAHRRSLYPVLNWRMRGGMNDDENLRNERPTFVTHLECAYTGERFEADKIHGLSSAGKPLLVRYDLPGVRTALSKDALAQRPPDIWRYRELLPVRKVTDIVSLGEALTPLVRLPNLSK